jgi:hypothetical protein
MGIRAGHFHWRTLGHDAAAAFPALRTTIQSASAITSRLCSMITTVLPASTRRTSTRIRRSTSAMCRPMVGSSSRYRERPPARVRLNSVTSLMRWASPPLREGLCCPRCRYPRPTSRSRLREWCTAGWKEKNSAASSTLMASTSAMLLSRKRTARVSGLKRAPPQLSHSTETSGRKLISMRFTPWPSQAWQRPPLRLKEKRPGE